MKLLHDTSGFTLIEILIATVIITVASLGVVNLTVGIINGNSFSKRLTTATTLAQDRLEQVKRIGYANVGTIVGTENYGDIVNYSGYKRITSVVNNIPMTNMKTVNVEVHWKTTKQPVNLCTILAE